nr:MAG TPA: hypothetical protein [Caudoviricetes sp.]
MKKTNYLFYSKYKGETETAYCFEDVEDAEKHIIDLLFMSGTQVRRKSRNVLSIKIDEDYTMLVVKETYEE